MRLPTFSRQSGSDTATDERPTAGGSTVAKPDDETTTRFTTAGGPAAVRRDPPPPPRPTSAPVSGSEAPVSESDRAKIANRDTDRTVEQPRVAEPTTPAGPKPRASLLATLGLVLGVVSALLVLSGPLLGYGIGLALLALVLSLAGIVATGKRHVAGKSDALLGTVLSLAAITVGVLALTGQLSWLGTDMQPVNTAREWLDAQFVDRF